MPVLGHAFVGLTAAVYAKPAVRCRGAAAALWTPILVGLAYLPDITSQLIDLAGLGRCRAATHSILAAVVAAVLLAAPLAGLAGMRLILAFALVLFSVLTHDLLDLLQGTDCRPFWPFWSRHINLPDQSFASGLGHELIWFGGGCAVLLMLMAVVRRVQKPGDPNCSPASAKPPAPRPPRGLVVAGCILTGMILLLAAGTHYLCDLRERQVAKASTLVNKGRPAEALPLLDLAGRWPHTAASAKVDRVRGQAYRALGCADQAERCYLAALRERPRDSETLEDLAMLYAALPEPSADRRRRVEPILAMLRSARISPRELQRITARVERALRRQSPPRPNR